MMFRDRKAAGHLLARKLAKYANRKDVLILALPRGGFPLGFEVETALNVPLDILVVRKLGVPGQEELAMGAIATGGIRVLNEEVISQCGISDHEIKAVSAREQSELRRRELAYRRDAAPPKISGHTIILIDDGIATGSTMRLPPCDNKARQKWYSPCQRRLFHPAMSCESSPMKLLS